MNGDATAVRCWTRSLATVELIEVFGHDSSQDRWSTRGGTVPHWYDAREVLAGRREVIIVGYGELSTELTGGNVAGPCFYFIQIRCEFLVQVPV